MDEQESVSSGHGASIDGEGMDQGRRYWRAAIAHLAPEKREAAWEFYLDRLESSPAADTLGGVMLLLEANIAFFDKFPTVLDAAAQRLESATQPITGAGAPRESVSSLGIAPGNRSKPSWKDRRFSLWAMGWTAVISGTLAMASVFIYRGFFFGQSSGRPATQAIVPIANLPKLSVEPWNDPVSHRTKGCVIVLKGAAWAETTRAGDAKVFVYSPVEEVRQNLRSLEQSTR